MIKVVLHATGILALLCQWTAGQDSLNGPLTGSLSSQQQSSTNVTTVAGTAAANNESGVAIATASQQQPIANDGHPGAVASEQDNITDVATATKFDHPQPLANNVHPSSAHAAAVHEQNNITGSVAIATAGQHPIANDGHPSASADESAISSDSAAAGGTGNAPLTPPSLPGNSQASGNSQRPENSQPIQPRPVVNLESQSGSSPAGSANPTLSQTPSLADLASLSGSPRTANHTGTGEGQLSVSGREAELSSSDVTTTPITTSQPGGRSSRQTTSAGIPDDEAKSSEAKQKAE